MTLAKFGGIFAVVGALVAGPAYGAEYPARTVTISVGYAAGGGMDLAARFFASKFSEMSGQQFIIANRPGAGGNLAAREVAAAKPDGHQLLWAPTATFAANPILFKDLPYDPIGSYELVSTVVEYGFLLVTRADSPASSVAELKTLLAAKPKATYGSLGSTTMAMASHFKSLAGIQAQYVTYKAMQEVIRDVSAGDLDFAIVDVPYGIQHAKTGRLKILGVTLPRRMSMAPDIPTLSEAGVPGFDVTGWMALAAPAGTSPDTIEALRSWLGKAMADPETQKFLHDNYYESFMLKPAETRQFLRAQKEKWRSLITAAGIKPY